MALPSMGSDFDVVVVGGSFAGLTLAHQLPRTMRVLVVDAKPTAGATVESTGLITVRTREELATFFPVDEYITNPITAICVVAPGFRDSFVSTTSSPWIFQTDTKGLVRHLAETLPGNVVFSPGTAFVGPVMKDGEVRGVRLLQNGTETVVGTRFLVGSDGGRSKVCASVPGLEANRSFLYGFEQVHYGHVHLGAKPEETISHFWFGEFSLGYGGWISPTVVNGRPAFRVGLAKLMKDQGDARQLLQKFVATLQERGMVSFEEGGEKPAYVFGSPIPIGGVRRKIASGNTLLIGDAAGFCGAFAADGIKGAVVSGKEAAMLVPRYLAGEKRALRELHAKMDRHDGLIGYYARQVRYRMIWDLMKRDRTFRAMFDIIAAERDSFLDQFCDSKDKRRSLARVVLKPRHVRKLLAYAWCIVRDAFN